MKGIPIGFTGTRWGMAYRQQQALGFILDCMSAAIIHHGGAEGADTECEQMAMQRGFNVIEHAPRAPISSKTLLERNRWIVNASFRMIAAPKRMREEQRSGTWATIRYAIKQQKPVLIIWPNGSMQWR